MPPVETTLDERAAYDYELPKELIAQHPLPERGAARLLVVDRAHQKIEHGRIDDLPRLLVEGDALAINDTRVVPARLVGRRVDTGGRWHGLWLSTDAHQVIELLCKTRSKLRPQQRIVLQDHHGRDDVELVLLARLQGGSWAARLASSEPVPAVLERIGRVPLPHYIRGGEMVDADVRDYQTVFARHAGSVAAPTAGLHLTEPLLQRLVDRGIHICPLTLHVGPGTFQPIATDRLAAHTMHAERFEVRDETARRLNAVRAAGGRIIAVGTTSVRTLESAVDSAGRIAARSGQTQLFIRPGHRFAAVDGLLTNFHLPRSTLLVLVRALGGDALIRRAYETAIAQRYRFFSYGDAMLIV